MLPSIHVITSYVVYLTKDSSAIHTLPACREEQLQCYFSPSLQFLPARIYQYLVCIVQTHVQCKSSTHIRLISVWNLIRCSYLNVLPCMFVIRERVRAKAPMEIS